jgi:hypothetical protein
VRSNNNRPEAPFRKTVDFTIQAEIVGINRLGQLLKDYGRLEHRDLKWERINGHLLQIEEAEQDAPSDGAKHPA